MIFGKSFEGETFGPMQLIGIGITDNQRYLILEVDNGVPAKRQDIYIKDLRKPDAPVRPLVHGIDNRFNPVNTGDDLYVLTDYQAENYRIIKLSDPRSPSTGRRSCPKAKIPSRSSLSSAASCSRLACTMLSARRASSSWTESRLAA